MKMETGIVILAVACVVMVIVVAILIWQGYELYKDLNKSFVKLNNLLCDFEDDTGDLKELFDQYKTTLQELSEKLSDIDVIEETETEVISTW